MGQQSSAMTHRGHSYHETLVEDQVRNPIGSVEERGPSTPSDNQTSGTDVVHQFFRRMVELERKGDPFQTPNDHTHDLARRFAYRYSLNPNFARAKAFENADEEALNQALSRLALSVIASHPANVSEWLPETDELDEVEGLKSADSVASSLQALCAIAPSLVSHGTLRTATAFPRSQLDTIAQLRSSC